MNGRYGAPRAASLSKEITWRPGQNYTQNRPSPVELSPSLLPWNRAAHRVQAAFFMGEDGELHGGKGFREALAARLCSPAPLRRWSRFSCPQHEHKHDRAVVRPSLDVYACGSARRRARRCRRKSTPGIQLERRAEDPDSTRHRVSPRRKAVVGTAPKPRRQRTRPWLSGVTALGTACAPWRSRRTRRRADTPHW